MIIPFGSLLSAFLSFLDIKERFFIGRSVSTSFKVTEDRYGSMSASEDDCLSPVNSYTNPVIAKNAPDPRVVRLVDGSGWAAVTTSNHATFSGEAVAFPIYHSSGRIG
jgi:hypothetical protein